MCLAARPRPQNLREQAPRLPRTCAASRRSTETGRLRAVAGVQREGAGNLSASAGPDHPSVGTVLQYGGGLREQGDYARSLEYNEKALAIKLQAARSSRSRHHVLQYGGGLRATGRLRAVAGVQREALAIKLQALGPDHPKSASRTPIWRRSTRNRATTRGRWSTTRRRWQSGGQRWAQIARSIREGGIKYGNRWRWSTASKGDYVRSLEYNEKALAIRLPALGPDHPEVGGRVLQYGAGLRETGRRLRVAGVQREGAGNQLQALGQIIHQSASRTAIWRWSTEPGRLRAVAGVQREGAGNQAASAGPNLVRRAG